jgi:hypothetical protein
VVAQFQPDAPQRSFLGSDSHSMNFVGDNKKGEKGEKRRGGRKSGTPNTSTTLLKEALLNAALAIGFPQEEKILDDDGQPTGEIKLVATGDGPKPKSSNCKTVWARRSFARIICSPRSSGCWRRYNRSSKLSLVRAVCIRASKADLGAETRIWHRCGRRHRNRHHHQVSPRLVINRAFPGSDPRWPKSATRHAEQAEDARFRMIEARLVRRHHVDHGRRRDVGSICTGGQVSGPRRETRISAIVYLNVYPRSKIVPHQSAISFLNC